MQQDAAGVWGVPKFSFSCSQGWGGKVVDYQHRERIGGFRLALPALHVDSRLRGNGGVPTELSMNVPLCQRGGYRGICETLLNLPADQCCFLDGFTGSPGFDTIPDLV